MYLLETPKQLLIIMKHSMFMWQYTDAVTDTKLYSKHCQYLIQTNKLSVAHSLTQPTSSQLSALSDHMLSARHFI